MAIAMGATAQWAGAMGASPAAAELLADDRARQDAELVERARVDPEAFGELYERYVSSIYRLVYSRLRSREEAEDVTSEIFFKALRAIDRYRPSGRPFRAWLYQIANNAIIDYLRTRKPAVELEAAGDRADPGAAVEDQVVNRGELADVWAAINRLNESQRLAITLKLAQDMHTVDIAACMGRSEGAVKLLIHRGLSTIRRELGRQASTGDAA